MHQIIIVGDVVGSTEAKKIYGEAQANKKIGAALALLQASMSVGDLLLRPFGSSAGDSLLMIGGADATGVYRASVIHQAVFKVWSLNRLPVKIVIGYDDFEIITDTAGVEHARGASLDFLHRICDYCPPGGVVIGPSMYAMLTEAGFGNRFIKIEEDLKGIGKSVFYESNGAWEIPLGERQNANHVPRAVPVLGQIGARALDHIPEEGKAWREFRAYIASQGPMLFIGLVIVALLLYRIIKAT